MDFQRFLVEARNPSLTYTEKKVKGQIDKVIVSLEGGQSGKFTKLSREFMKLKKANEALTERTNQLNARIKDEALELFDAQDEIYTRIVETVSMTMTVSKKVQTVNSKTDFEKVVEELTSLVPEIADQIKMLIEANTVKSEVTKSPGLRVTINEEDISSVQDLILEAVDFKKVYSNILKKVRSWASKFDKRAQKIKNLIAKL